MRIENIIVGGFYYRVVSIGVGLGVGDIYTMEVLSSLRRLHSFPMAGNLPLSKDPIDPPG